MVFFFFGGGVGGGGVAGSISHEDFLLEQKFMGNFSWRRIELRGVKGFAQVGVSGDAIGFLEGVVS